MLFFSMFSVCIYVFFVYLFSGDPNIAVNGGIPRPIKERKKHDRFNGMPEEEVSKRTLPDHLAANLDIIIVSFFSHINRVF